MSRNKHQAERLLLSNKTSCHVSPMKLLTQLSCRHSDGSNAVKRTCSFYIQMHR